MQASMRKFDQHSCDTMKFWTSAYQEKNKGNYQACVDLALEGVQATPNPWVATRYLLFCLATHTVRQNLQQLDQTTRRTLRDKFFKNYEEPTVFRTEAAFTLAAWKEKEGDAQGASDYIEDALALSDDAEKEELGRSFWFGTKNVTCKELLECKRVGLDLNLRRLEGNGATKEELARFHDMNSRIGLESVNTPIRFFHSDVEKSILTRVSFVGGKNCDHCNKGSDEIGMNHFRCCSRCQMAYYCSRECQRKQWQDGHKEHCRKKGQIVPGDFMVLRRLGDLQSLNGKPVRVVAKASSGLDQWEVELLSEDRVLSVSAGNLNRIRPEK